MEAYESIRTIKGIGEKTASNYEKLGVFTVGDLLMHYPRDYDYYGDECFIEDLRPDENSVIIAAPVSHANVFRKGSRSLTSVYVQDSSGRIELTWFNMPYISKTLHTGVKYIFRGRVSWKGKRLVMRQPKILTKEDYYNNRHRLLPIYPLTGHVTNNSIKKAVKQALESVSFPRDTLPAPAVKMYGLIGHKEALNKIHFPNNRAEYRQAHKRLAFEEFYDFLSKINAARKRKKLNKTGFIIDKQQFAEAIEKILPFELTEGQKKALSDIKHDLGSGVAMARLLEGDVGCGKTVVCLLAMCMAHESGYQSALMAPTEVLAVQHYNFFTEALKDTGTEVILLNGGQKAAERREALEKIRKTPDAMIIGTHALIQESVSFSGLGLVITDEQHRFGVAQKKKLQEKGIITKETPYGDTPFIPHMLVMSATPIPRSLAATLYGDLDISFIASRPVNRLPVKNAIIDESYRDRAYTMIAKQVLNGHKAYIICPVIDASDNIAAEGCIEYTEKIKDYYNEKKIYGIRVGMIHGRMKANEKEAALDDFVSGRTNLLVATTVIEVGIDVADATVILIENSERFGLAELHQLRGRVGRSDLQSYCMFMVSRLSPEIMQRLSVLKETNDGFRIAEEDLKNRGPGEIFGTRQSGELTFKTADIYRDADILKEAIEAVKTLEG